MRVWQQHSKEILGKNRKKRYIVSTGTEFTESVTVSFLLSGDRDRRRQNYFGVALANRSKTSPGVESRGDSCPADIIAEH